GKALVAYEFSGTSTDIVARIFDGATNTIGNQFLIADHAASLANAKTAALDDHRVVIVYTDTHDVFARVYDANNGTLSQEITIGWSGLDDFQPDVAVTLDGGFIVTWAGSNGVKPEIRAQRFNSDGVAMGDSFVVSEPSAGDQNHPSVSISGVTAFFAWSDFGTFPGDADPSSVRGQVLSLTTQPDFNNDARTDILWRNATGTLPEWMMNGNRIVSSTTPSFNGALEAPDAGWHTQAKPANFA